MLNWEERRQLVKVAMMYYREGWTQQQIAKKIGVSRPVISKMIQKAKDAGIVEVYIQDESAHTVELEQKLEQRFELQDVVVVPSLGFTPDMTRHAVGQAAAHYLSRHLRKDIQRFGISWGTTLAEVVREYPYERRESLNIVPLVGGMGTKSVEIHANQLAYELAKKMNATCSYLYAPAIVETEELAGRLMEMQDIAQVLEEGKQVEVALVGIGNPHKGSTMKDIGYLKETDIQSLKKAGAIGDIGSRFFDQDGEPLVHELNKRIIGLRLRDLRSIPHVIGIAEGAYKAESIAAALAGKYIHTLIIDEQTAVLLLQM